MSKQKSLPPLILAPARRVKRVQAIVIDAVAFALILFILLFAFVSLFQVFEFALNTEFMPTYQKIINSGNELTAIQLQNCSQVTILSQSECQDFKGHIQNMAIGALLISVLTTVFYFMLPVKHGLFTLGKKLTKVKVVSEAGGSPTYLQVFVRYLLVIALVFTMFGANIWLNLLPVFGVLVPTLSITLVFNYFGMLVDINKQTYTDKISGTMVLEEVSLPEKELQKLQQKLQAGELTQAEIASEIQKHMNK